MQSCFSLGPWMYANENEEKSEVQRKHNSLEKIWGVGDCKDQLERQTYYFI